MFCKTLPSNLPEADRIPATIPSRLAGRPGPSALVVTKRYIRPTDRVNIEQSAKGRLEGRVLKKSREGCKKTPFSVLLLSTERWPYKYRKYWKSKHLKVIPCPACVCDFFTKFSIGSTPIWAENHSREKIMHENPSLPALDQVSLI